MSPEDRDALFKGLDGDDDDDDETEAMDKGEGADGDGDGDDLLKSLSALERAVGFDPPPSAVERFGAGEHATLMKSMDATGFVAELVQNTAEHLDELGGHLVDVAGAVEAQHAVVTAAGAAVVELRKSFAGSQDTVEQLRKSVEANNELLGRLLTAVGSPEQRRSVTAKPLAKSFQTGDGGGLERLTKGQVSKALLDHQRALQDRGASRDEIDVASSEVVRFGSTGQVSEYARGVLSSRGLLAST